MRNEISDEAYRELADGAYKSDEGVKINNKRGSEEWEPIHPKGAKLHDKETGFDATVYQNKVTGDIVVAYRGTEGKESLDRSVPDFITDAKYILMGKNPIQDGEKIDPYDKSQVIAASQFTQSVSLLEIVKKEYPNQKISTTGHSLGGANAQFASAICGVPAVTYSAPGVYDMLPKDIQKKVDAGEYKGQITNYINPKDTISGGALREDKTHIGDTYMVNSDFKTANNDYGMHQIDRFLDSIGAKDFHGIKNYHVDAFGNIDNSMLVDANTGEKIYRSPRFSIGGVGEVRVLMEYLEESAKKMQQSAEEFQNQIPRVVSEVMQHLSSTKSQRLEKRIEELYHCLDQTSRVYATKAGEVSAFIKRKADEYKTADENFQGFEWLKK
ncbi:MULTISPECIES: lipase family protein [unclassified Bacillus (in: firmicutes)]|uniref:lipase family protein n=1 Tax=unclassified Bacillus (in: firmicutes) TaxID=185979 RepID=UPI0030F57B7C